MLDNGLRGRFLLQCHEHQEPQLMEENIHTLRARIPAIRELVDRQLDLFEQQMEILRLGDCAVFMDAFDALDD
jgi:hypothetical protein